MPHDSRWSLPLPSFAETLAYRDEVLERVIDRLERGDGRRRTSRELAVRHEDMHAEAFHYTRQTLGYPAPDADDVLRASAATGDAEYAGGVFRLGASRGEGFVFDNEKWSHPVVLEPFRIARRPVTNGEYRQVRGGRRQGAALLEGRQGAALRPLDPDPGRRAGDARELARRAGLLRAGPAAGCRPRPNGNTPRWPAWRTARQASGNGPRAPSCRIPGFLRDPYKEYSEPWFGTHKVLRGGSFATPPGVAHAALPQLLHARARRHLRRLPHLRAVTVLRSRDNPKVKRWAKLASDARYRRSEKRALIEGPHLVAAALQHGSSRWPCS